VFGAVAVVAGTLLMIWLLRPGAPGTEGTGGIATRQPRATWLVVGTLAALVWFSRWALRGEHRWREKTLVLLVVGGLLLVGVSVAAGIAWPGGLLREYRAPLDLSDLEELPDLTTTLPTGTTATTGAGGATASTAPGTETSGPTSTAPPPTSTGSP